MRAREAVDLARRATVIDSMSIRCRTYTTLFDGGIAFTRHFQIQ
jgi:hypothetical protein